SPPHRAEYVGEPGRARAGGGNDGAVSRGDCVSDPFGPGRGPEGADAAWGAVGWRGGPWGERGAVSARSGWERGGVVLGPAEGVMAARCGRRACDVYAGAGFGGAAGGCGRCGAEGGGGAEGSGVVI